MPRRSKLKTLTPDPKNARIHSDRNIDLIADSIARRGFGRSMLIANDGTIIAGNATAKAAEAAGLDDLLIIDSDGTKAIAIRRTDVAPGTPEFEELGIADNRAAEEARWNLERLRLMQSEGLDLGRFWTPEEVARLFAEQPPKKRFSDPDDIPDIPATPVTRNGDLWKLGPHRLLCADSTQTSAAPRLLGDRRADLVVTDPPYGVAYVGKTADALTIENDRLGDQHTRTLVARALEITPLRPGGAFYVFSPAGRTELAFRLAIADAGLELRQALVWVKHHFVMGRQDYHWRHESILYGWKDGAAHYFADDLTQDTVVDDQQKLTAMSKSDLIAHVKMLERRLKETVLREDRPARSELHPTIKPAALVGRLIDNSSRRGEIVFDGFAGSGTTLIAAEERDRVAALVELDPRYADVIVERWQAFTGGKATVEHSNG